MELAAKEDQKREEVRNKNEEKLRSELQARIKELEDRLGTANERRASDRRASSISEGIGGIRFLPKFRIMSDEEEAEGRRKLEKAQEDLEVEIRRRQKAEQTALQADQKLVAIEVQLRDYEERFRREFNSGANASDHDDSGEASTSTSTSGRIGQFILKHLFMKMFFFSFQNKKFIKKPVMLRGKGALDLALYIDHVANNEMADAFSMFGGKLSEMLIALRKEESKRAEMEAQVELLRAELSKEVRTPAEVLVTGCCS